MLRYKINPLDTYTFPTMEVRQLLRAAKVYREIKELPYFHCGWLSAAVSPLKMHNTIIADSCLRQVRLAGYSSLFGGGGGRTAAHASTCQPAGRTGTRCPTIWAWCAGAAG